MKSLRFSDLAITCKNSEKSKKAPFQGPENGPHEQGNISTGVSEDHKLTPEAIDAILMEQKPNQKERIVLRGERFSRLFPPDLPVSKREDYVAAAMEHYARFREKQRSRDDAR